MNWSDFFNGAFELVGAALICLSIRRLWIDGIVKGVSAVPVTFFALWGFWNLFFYPANDLWWSFTGGMVMVAANGFWLGQMLWYIANPRVTVTVAK